MMARNGLLVLLALLALACRSPLTNLPAGKEGPVLRLEVGIEDHSRKLSRLCDPAGVPDMVTTRREALERYRAYFEAGFRSEAAARGLRLDPSAGLELDLTITSLGEVRAKYIVWGILSGVGWGVGTGLVAHDPRLAVGLGAYELVEESAFWIGGSVLMGRWSSPAVVEAKVRVPGSKKSLWEETYHVLWARRELAAFPPEEQKRREVQIQASLQKVLGHVFHDLEAIPAFPAQVRPSSAESAPAPLPPG
jgi:hypothetical protein